MFLLFIYYLLIILFHFPLSFIYIIPVFVWVQALAIVFAQKFIHPVVSILTFFKGSVLVATVSTGLTHLRYCWGRLECMMSVLEYIRPTLLLTGIDILEYIRPLEIGYIRGDKAICNS